MAEHERRKAARKRLSNSGYSIGGHLTKRPDEIADKHEISEGIHEHESGMHPGKKKTRLHLKNGGNCEGMAAGGRSDRKPRGGSKGKKGGTTVNVVVAHPHPKPVPVPVPVGGGPAGPPPPMPPGAMAGGPPVPPPDGGGAPMGAKKGGRTGYKNGGKTKAYPIDDGAGGGLGRLEKAKAYGA